MVVRLRRHRLLAMLCGLVAAIATAAPAAAALSDPTAPATTNRAEAAAGWLARQMVDGERFEAVFGDVTYPDQGLTIDAVFAFAAAHVADDHATRATAWLATPDILTGYVGDGTTEAYAGATAKLALAVEVRGGDPASFGGIDLVARLRSLQQPSGRFTDRSAWGDYSNAFSQSLAILELDRTAAGAPSTAVDFLAHSRCADGGYPLRFAQSTCTSDVDATAMAVQALLATDRAADAAAGLNWLVSKQGTDGGFVDGAGVTNANSTGLAAQALRVGGHWQPAVLARAYLIDLQVGCDGAPADRGAIDYDGGTFDAARAPRATAQALLGLTGVGYAQLSAVDAARTVPVLACS
jgi:hypothetical protein